MAAGCGDAGVAAVDRGEVKRCAIGSEGTLRRSFDVPGDLAEKDWRDVAALMKRYGRTPSESVVKLLVGAALANLDKP